MYDGSSFAKNQDVVFVSFNYRTNVFGFPKAPDISISRNNLGFLDQNLALAWVQDNIAQFGGDKSKVTIMVRTISRDAWVTSYLTFVLAGPICRGFICLTCHHHLEFDCRPISRGDHVIRRAGFHIPDS